MMQGYAIQSKVVNYWMNINGEASFNALQGKTTTMY